MLRDRALAALEPAHRPAMVLAAMVSLYTVVFGWLCWNQHANWSSFGFDTGIHDQGIWLVAKGHDPFVTIRGLDYFGHHVNLISLLFVPLYALGGGVELLTVTHTLWVASAAIPLFLLGRDRGLRPWVALVPAGAYLLHPATQWITWWLYHPDSMAIAPLCFAWWLARSRRWRWFAVAIAVALACKEDVALAVAALGFALLLTNRWRAGWLTVAAGGLWFLFCTRIVIPWRTGAVQPFYEAFFPSLGTTPTEILANAIRHPSRVIELAGRPANGPYMTRMLGPYAGLSLLAIPAALVGVPQLGVNLTVEVVAGATIKSQYATLPLVGMTLAMVEGLAWLARKDTSGWFLRAGVILLAACSLSFTWTDGMSPLSRSYVRRGEWAREPRFNQAELEAAKRLVGPTAGMAASYNIDTQFTHRRIDYEWPNPWMSTYYGVDGATGDPSKVDFIVLELAAASTPPDVALLDQLTGPDGEFDVVYRQRGVLVAKRRAPAP